MTMDHSDFQPGVSQGNGERRADGRFAPGVSGNPSGRPKGARNKTTMAVEALLDGEAEVLTRKIMHKALDGDTAALQFCVARLLAPRRDRPVEVDLPDIASADDAVKAARAILAACAAGILSPREASDVIGVIDQVRKLELGDFEERLTRLERSQQA
jgi:hypothetical protein